MTDPLLRLVAALPPAEPNRARAARVRAKCHAVLERTRPRPATRRRQTTFFWEPLVAGLGGLYLTETIRQVLHVYGVL
jgi:hypothetical protein